MDVFGGNEYDCTLRQVWQAEAYNDDCLRFVDFYGTYTTETEVNHDMDLVDPTKEDHVPHGQDAPVLGAAEGS